MNRQLFTITALSIGVISFAHGQNRAANVDRAITTTRSQPSRYSMSKPASQLDLRSAPELFSGEMEDVGPQYLVERQNDFKGGPDKGGPGDQRHYWFEGYADAQMFYTSNALLTEKGNRDTGVMVYTLQAAFAAKPFELLGGQVATRAGYRHQWWMYSLDKTSNQLNNFDFAVGTAFIQWRHSWDEKWVATFELDYTRYLAHEDSWKEFYVELAPTWSLERNFQIGEKGQLTIGYYGAYHWTQTDPAPVSHINDRLDTTIGIYYTQEILPGLLIQPFYRAQWSHYTENSDRNDAYNTLGLAVVYNLNSWASVRGSVNWENRNSTDDTVADYQKWDIGGGITFVARF